MRYNLPSTIPYKRNILEPSLEIHMTETVLGEFIENDGVLAQEKQTLKCPELSNPNSLEELKELRDCLQNIKFEIQNGRRIQKIQRSYEGSLELVKQLNLVMDNKTSKQISNDSLLSLIHI